MTDFVDVTQAEALEREVAALLRRLIGCDTSNPPGGETQAAAILEDYLTAAGLHCERVGEDEGRRPPLVHAPPSTPSPWTPAPRTTWPPGPSRGPSVTAGRSTSTTVTCGWP